MSGLAPRLSIARTLRGGPQAKVLDIGRERDLLLRYHDHHDAAAMRELVEAHMPMILRAARRNARNPGTEYDDLVQTATEGLLIAINRWSFARSDAAGANVGLDDADDAADGESAPEVAMDGPGASSRLVTYAMWWMRSLLNDRVLEGRGMVARTRNRETRTAFFALPRAIRMLNLQTPLGDSDIHRIAAALGLDAHEVREALMHAAGDVMLDEPIGDGQTTRGEVLADARAESEAELVERLTTANTWNAVCAQVMALRPRDRFVVIARFLLDSKWKLDRLSEVLRMSRERIRQISDASLAELRRALAAHGVQDTPDRRAAARELARMVDAIERASASDDPQALARVMQQLKVPVGPSRGRGPNEATAASAGPLPSAA